MHRGNWLVWDAAKSFIPFFCHSRMHFSPFRSLLQQLQKLQSLFSGKIVPHSCKMASTQTGTCLMVSFCCLVESAAPDAHWLKETLARTLANVWFLQMMALCFILVLGSFSSCISPLSPLTETSPLSSSSPKPLPSTNLYTTQGRSITIHLMPVLIFVSCGYRIMDKVCIFLKKSYFLYEFLICFWKKQYVWILDCRRFFDQTVCQCCGSTLGCTVNLYHLKYICSDFNFKPSTNAI